MDHWVAQLLAPLAFWIVLSGLDDCIVDVAAGIAWLRLLWRNEIPSDEELAAVPPRRMAIFVPAWREHRVIQSMLDNNLARLRYPQVDLFVGAYPNDQLTVNAVREAMKRHPNVHLSVCPHDGPTSKADCLNWIYRRMLFFEADRGERFEMVIIHDAEDIIDPDALHWINYYAQWNDMVQLPVLALPTPFHEMTHGVYCDEFSESQHKDMMARGLLGGFIPSTGVGVGFSRRALDQISATHENRIFEPECLTEDYENGFRVASLGLPQKFIPIHIRHGRAIATREFFPRRFPYAVRQRARWVTGIGLQSWELHSLSETLRHGYWFWRDRKSLIGNFVGPLANLFFVYGATTLAWSASHHHPWAEGNEHPWLALEAAAAIALQAIHTTIRVFCCARIYGWKFAAGVPFRIIFANSMNCIATGKAIAAFAAAKWHKRPLRWVKTDHVYLSHEALLTGRKRIGEILVAGGWLTTEQLETALASQPGNRRLGERLMLRGLISEAQLYRALALQNDLPLGKPEPSLVSRSVTRTLPSAIARKWRVLPFRIAAGELYLAGSEIPNEQMQNAIRQFSSLTIRFRLVTPTDYEELAAKYLN